MYIYIYMEEKNQKYFPLSVVEIIKRKHIDGWQLLHYNYLRSQQNNYARMYISDYCFGNKRKV